MAEIIDQTADKTFVKELLGTMQDTSPMFEELKAFSEKELCFKSVVSEVEDLVEGERAAVHWISTKAVDKQKDVMVPSGCDFELFDKTRTVFVDHGNIGACMQYPVEKVLGSSMWAKNQNDRGILAKTAFANTQLGNDCYSLVKDKHVKSWSIGAIPIEIAFRHDSNWASAIKLAAGNDNQAAQNMSENAARIMTNWKLYEYSLSPFTVNTEALTLAVSKGLQISPDTLHLCGIDMETICKEADAIGVDEPEVKAIVRIVKRVIPRRVSRVSAPLTESDVQRSVTRAINIHKGNLG